VAVRAIVTAGGTREPIDDVRFVTNLSKGRFGAAISNALVGRGVEVTLLASRELASHPEWVDARVRVVSFGSAADLDATLSRELAGEKLDLLFMAAAVADYAPVPVEGKIRSDADELVLRMRRTPKILGTLRERCGPSTFLVGFKLLSGVPAETLVAAGLAQVARDDLDLTVANDLRELTEGAHPVWMCGPDGSSIRVEGDRARVASEIADFCLLPRKPAVSVCLIDTARRAVLLGPRKTAPNLGSLAFPGGRIKPGEDPLAAAHREVEEETGVVLPAGDPLWRMSVVAGEFLVENFGFEVAGAPEPRASAEMDAHWVALGAEVEPLTAGTRRILRWRANRRG
jgi:8-oxo-dGTP pyrophosphatase MutT (NUDIX family)